MDLANLWFGIIAVLWVGFFVLDGFDLGVGSLHQVVGRTDTERRVAINAIGPFWDGNEVWLIVGGAAIFAAFPAWYAAMFSSLYLALVLVLLALIVRGVAFEWRGKGRSPGWAKAWSWGLTVSSLLIPFLLGVGIGDLLAGLPLDADGNFTGTFWDLLTLYGLLTGLTLTLLCLLHGALFLSLKTDGPVRRRSTSLVGGLWLASMVSAVVWIVATHVVASGVGWVSIVLQAVAAIAIVSVLPLARGGREGWAFSATAVTIAAAVGSFFAALFPNVMVSSAGSSLTIASSSSADYSLTVMTIVAAVMVPIVLAYQGYTYWVFRSRVRVPFATGPSVSEDVTESGHGHAEHAEHGQTGAERG